MIPSPEYNTAAYMLAIAEAMERHVLEVYVDGDSPATQTILSERVLYIDREVPQAALHKFLEVVRQIQKQAQEQMAQYEFRRRVDSDFKVSIKDEEKTDGKPVEAPPQVQEVAAPVPSGAEDRGTGDKDRKPGGGGGPKR